MSPLAYALVMTLAAVVPAIAAAAPSLRSAVVFDDATLRDDALVEALRVAAGQVALGDYTVALPLVISADGRRAGVRAALESALADPQVDVVIVADPIGSMVAGEVATTERPLVALAGLVGGTMPEARDGLALGVAASIAAGIESLRRFGSVDRVAIVARADLEADLLGRAAAVTGVEFTYVAVADDGTHAAFDGVDAVWIGPLSGLDAEARSGVLRAVADAGLRSWGAMGPSAVAEGALLGPSESIDRTRAARSAAFAMQRLMQRAPVAEVFDLRDSRPRVAMNAATARGIGFEPPWSALQGVRLVSATAAESGAALSLVGAVEQALLNNLQARNAAVAVDRADADRRVARAALLPSLRAAVDAQANTVAGSDVAPGASYTLDGSLTLTQLLYSDQAWAGAEVARLAARAERRGQESVLLDVVSQAASGWLGVARAKAQFEVQQQFLEFSRKNLALAEARIAAGQAAHGDIARWQSQLAADEAAAVDAGVGISRARLALAAAVGRADDRAVDVPVMALDALRTLVIDERVWAALGQRDSAERLEQFLVERGLDSDPELARFALLRTAQERQLTASRRALFLPQLSLQAGLSQPLWDHKPASPIPDGRDGTALFAGLSVSLPLFEGTARYGRIDQAAAEVSRVSIATDARAQAIEQGIRDGLRRTAGAFVRVQLEQRSAAAARQSMEQVRGSYAQGAVGVTQLIDTQQALQRAEGAVINAVFGYLIAVVETSRRINTFYFLLTPAERAEWARDLTRALATKEAP